MAEIVPTFLIHNMFKAQSSRVQRAHSPVPHTANERVMGRRILPKRPIRITEKEFKANEAEILAKIREGRLAVTCPDLSFIDSLPDGRLVITYLNKKTEEEPSSPAFKKWPYKGDSTPASLADLPKEVIFGSDPVPYPDPPGPRTEPELSPQPEGTDAGWDGGPTGAVGEPGIPGHPDPVGPKGATVEPVLPAEDLTKELMNPDEVLVETQVPPVQDTITLDMPKKGKKSRKE